MTDLTHLVWRLRHNATARSLCGEAADVIESLEEALRALLNSSAKDEKPPVPWGSDDGGWCA